MLLSVTAALAFAAAGDPAADKPLPIGYLEIEDDARYDERRAAARFPAQPWGRPFDGARVAIEESEFAGSAAGRQVRAPPGRGRRTRAGSPPRSRSSRRRA